LVRKIIDYIFEIPFFYRYLRAIGTFGVRTAPIRKMLDIQDGESLLDVACGIGDYSVLAESHNKYVGVDLNIRSIALAKKLYGAPNRKFKVMDVTKMSIDQKFDRAIVLAILHHLSDNEVITMLTSLKRLVKKRIVIMDAVYTRYHFINNFIYRFDRGRYVRSLSDQTELVSKALKVLHVSTYFVRTLILKYSLIVCEVEEEI